MDTALICNTILDICGVLILLVFLLPYFSGGRIRTINRRKRNLLFYAALVHFFALLLRFAGRISVSAAIRRC